MRNIGELLINVVNDDRPKMLLGLDQKVRGTDETVRCCFTRYREHKLIGNYKDRRECHIEPDWLLIYKITEADIIFERTGSHSALF